ncbi:hypothetical protein ESCO_000809 [Escovopsis weberi]|uniref:Uncharacterized protein n=1 Tax=Escovopsis weberi TaxID=150374 RepID=A0A0M8N1W0_ESCWE|nr:hypothetical protein ESCO_000809 [Escovopsis weberi]
MVSTPKLSDPNDEIVTELIYSTAAAPPTRCDETVRTLCVIRWSRVPDFEALPSWVNAKGETFRTVHYDVKMVANGVSLDFEISHEGTVVASKNVAVDFDTSGSLFRPPTHKGDNDGDDSSDADYQDGAADKD